VARVRCCKCVSTTSSRQETDYKVRLALRWLGIPFQYQHVDILKGESRTPSFLAKNPFGQIPVLELDDGTYLRESSAILMYLRRGDGALARRQAAPNARLGVDGL
jgi:glutathione S-transferase